MNLRKGIGNQELPDRGGEGVKVSKGISKQDPGLGCWGGGGGSREREKKKRVASEATTFSFFFFFFFLSLDPPPPQGLPETKGQGTAKALKGPLHLCIWLHCIQLALQSTTSLPPITSKCLLHGV